MRADAGLLLCVAVLAAGCASLPPASGRGRDLRYTPEEPHGPSRQRGSQVWFKKSGAKALVEQAQRQLRAAKGTGARIRWHIAEQKTAEAIRKLFENNDIEGIEVVFTPPLK